MANQSTFLNLTLPGFNEYTDAWGDVMVDNFSAIDLFAYKTATEVTDARFSKANLKAFLEVGHNSDGTLKATDEMVQARASRHLGRKDLLSDRASLCEAEVWKAFFGQGDLASGLAMAGGKKSLLLSAPAGWVTATGSTLTFNGAVTPIWILIEGRPYRIRTSKTSSVSGASGTRYIYVEKPANDTAEGKVKEGTTGIISSDTALGAVNFTQSGVDFSADVKPGDILRISGQVDQNATVNGDYVIEAVTAGNLKIAGKFPVTSLSSISWNVIDPYAVKVGVDTAITTTSGRFYVGTCSYDGTSTVSSVSLCQAGDTYVSEWVTVSSGTHDFFGTSGCQFNHSLMTDEITVAFQVKNGTSVEVVPGAARLLWDKTKVMVKSTATYSSSFYTKFDGTTTGSIEIRVVARKRG